MSNDKTEPAAELENVTNLKKGKQELNCQTKRDEVGFKDQEKKSGEEVKHGDLSQGEVRTAGDG